MTQPPPASPQIRLILAEKPSVARDIANVINATKAAQGYFYSDTDIVTWSIGHVLGLAPPKIMNPKWQYWRAADLPIVPKTWKLVENQATKSQLDVLISLLKRNDIEVVINAMDAGREGELIFNEIYEYANSLIPVKRLWLSSLTYDAIKSAFAQLKPRSEYIGLGAAARYRSQADWLIGMNMSRALSLHMDETFSVGRVQTPTLKMVVDRDEQIEAFRSSSYYSLVYQLHAVKPEYTFLSSIINKSALDDGTLQKIKSQSLPQKLDKSALRFSEEELPDAPSLAKLESSDLSLVACDSKINLEPPELLFDLTSLQKKANILFKFSAQKTLDLAQKLYDEYKLITYPRTNSRYLTSEVANELPEVLNKTLEKFGLSTNETELRLTESIIKRNIYNNLVEDHHAIIPTGKDYNFEKLPLDCRKLLELIYRNFIAIFADSKKNETIRLLFKIASHTEMHSYTAKTFALEYGHAALFDTVSWGRFSNLSTRKSMQSKDEIIRSFMKSLCPGDITTPQAFSKNKENTQPPRHYTEATLLSAMEYAGKNISDSQLKQSLRGKGLGTASTRASIIESLLHRKYMTRDKQYIKATNKGKALIKNVNPNLASPELTAEWEHKLYKIEKSNAEDPSFIHEIVDFLQKEVKSQLTSDPRKNILNQGLAEISQFTAMYNDAKALSSDHLNHILKLTFKLPKFRPHQEDVCQAILKKQDVIVVMPTGAGKSLCYQLPPLIAGKPALIISPLISLMNDQVYQLNQKGLKAAAIHSGVSKSESRNICNAFYHKKINFLYIAPERLRIPGFSEFLHKCEMSLIAIDEAHCISQWGHDFRPDYRLIGEKLTDIKATPIIALTATATPDVQADIESSLLLNKPFKVVAGFKRENIAIKIAELPDQDRLIAVKSLLKQNQRLPAIIYTLTRSEADRIANELSSTFKTASYHAGKTPLDRQQIQEKFLNEDIQLIVATIAFGMGINKHNIRTVIHYSLPNTIEGYYQEIGRAGRDGMPSLALCFWSYKDRLTHDFFLSRDFPDISQLQQLFSFLKAQTNPVFSFDLILSFFGNNETKAMSACNALISCRALKTPDRQNLSIIDPKPSWEETYKSLLFRRKLNLQRLIDFVCTDSCRMHFLCQYFGEAVEKDCGQCDNCLSKSGVLTEYRSPHVHEISAFQEIVKHLELVDSVSVGKLYRDNFPKAKLSQRNFERLLTALLKNQLIDIETHNFKKNDRNIQYQTASLVDPDQKITKSEFRDIRLFEIS